MSNPGESATGTVTASPLQSPRGFSTALIVVVAAFSWPLYQLARFSIGHELYSHIVLIPCISLYLAWQLRGSLRTLAPAPSNPRLAVVLGVVGALLIATWGLTLAGGTPLSAEDSLALTTLSFLAFFVGTCAWFLPRTVFRALRFPLLFLLFMVPIPVLLTDVIETFLQQGSAAVARLFFTMAGTTVFAQGLVFQLPGITLQVAPECSGIHSSLALLITSVLAGYYFLRSPMHRAVLALCVIPLALLRNGFRVFVIGELCVHIRPEMIDSYIHRHGGPIFFVLSLIPFFLLMLWLMRREKKSGCAV